MNDMPLNDEEATRIADAYWVEPGLLMAGEYPGAKDELEARLKLRWLLQQGIDVWVDLTEPGNRD